MLTDSSQVPDRPDRWRSGSPRGSHRACLRHLLCCLPGLLLGACLGCSGLSVEPRPGQANEPRRETIAPGVVPEGVSQPDPAQQQVMVTLRPAPAPIWDQLTLEIEQTYSVQRVVAWTMSLLGEQCVVFNVPRGHSASDLVARMSHDPRISLAQTVQRFRTQGLLPTGDAHTQLQHSAHSLHLQEAHRWATGKGVKVAVIDTGVDTSHPDLRGRILLASNFVDRNNRAFTSDVHGTAVAGVIAANANERVGFIGVAPQAEILALKACWQQPPGAREAVCDSYTLARAVDFAVKDGGAQVLNFSLAGPSDPILGQLISKAIERGVVVVAAESSDPSRSFPASLNGVIGVAGSNDLEPASRPALRGLAGLVLAAPGIDVLSTAPHGHYDLFSGSSLAAAQVSGAAALVLERDPKVSPANLASLFHATARPIPAADGFPAQVAQVDACALLVAALKAGTCS